jgi:hypothetical protein
MFSKQTKSVVEYLCSISRYEVVTADGKITVATPSENSDLFHRDNINQFFE